MGRYELIGDFQQEVLEKSREIPVLVDFWAQWCGPCRVLGPTLEKLAGDGAGRFALVKVDTELHPELAAHYGIRSIPAVKLFIDGGVAGEFVGALPEAQIRAWLDEHLPGQVHEIFLDAQRRLAAGDEEEGRRLLDQVLELEPGHEGALVAKAGLLVRRDPTQAVALLEPVDEWGDFGDHAAHLQRLARQVSLVGSGAEQALEHDPDHRPDPRWVRRYLEGNGALARGDFAAAIEAWIDVMAHDRALDDDGARRACIALFDHLGPEHEVTRDWHGRFTSALF
jgi:putative thioredoxin